MQGGNVNIGLNLESASFVSGAQQARRAMQQSLAGIQSDVSKTSLALQGATAAVGGFVKGLALTAGAGVSIAGIVGIATRAAREFAEAEQAQVKFASVLKATGNTAGVTSAEVSKLADAMEATGTVTAEAVTSAAAELATFKSVSGDTFTTALKLAQDLSVVFGQSLSSSAVQLGKALQDPVEGISALKRVGVSFNDTQLELIKGFVDTGQAAKAQQLILQELAAQVGGATNAQADTLTGSFNAANAALGNFLEALFAASGAAETSKGAFEGIIGILNQGSEALKEGGISKLLFGNLVSDANAATSATEKLHEAFRQLERLEVDIPPPNVTPPSGRIYPSATDEQRVKEYLEFQKPLLDEIAASEKKLADEREAAGEKAASQAAATQQRLESEAKSREKLIEQADFEAASAERLAEANDESAEAYKRVQNEIEAERRILAASSELKGEELQIYRDLNQAREEAENRILATNQAREEENKLIAANKEFMERIARDADKRAEDKTEAQKKEADKLADIYAQPFKDLATNLASTLSEGIQDAISGDFDFNTFAEGFGDVFADTLAASITSALTPALTGAAKSFGDYLTNAIKSGTVNAPGLTMGGAALGGAFAGGVGGGLYGAFAPGLKPGNFAGIGGTIGGGLGGAAGYALTAGNPVGALVGAGLGGLLGSVTGGLFGGQNNLGNDRSAQAYRSGRGIVYSDSSFSQENRSITEGILGEVASLEEAFLGLGGVVDGVRLRIEAGNKSGITVNGKRYDTAEEALRASIEQLIGGTTGLSATQQTVLANTKGGTAATIGADLAFGERYDELIYQGTQFDLALRNLGRTFEQDARQATELGLDVTALAAARDREAAEIQRQADQAGRGIYEQLAAASGDFSVGTQLHVLETQMRELAEAADGLNIPLEAVTAAHVAAAHQIVVAAAEIARQRDQTTRSISEQLAAIRGDKSLTTQLHVLETQMRELAKAAADAGISLNEVTAAHNAAVTETVRVYDQQRRSVSEQLAATRGDKSLATQLHILETQMRELGKAASDVGIPLSEVTKAHIVAATELARVYDQQRRGVSEQIAAARGDTSLATQLHVLETQMRDLAKAAAEVGIPLLQVNEAHAKAAAILREEFEARKRALNAQVDELGQFGKPLDRSLGQLRSQVEQLERELIAAGLPLDQLAEAHRRAAQQIKEDWEESLRDMRRQQRDMTQGLVEAQRSAAGAVDQFLDPITEALSSRGIGQGVYAGAALTQSGLSEFRSMLEQARTGDTGALSSLVGIGQGAISQARQTYGSTAAFASIFEEIQRGLQEQQGTLEQKRDQLLEDIGEVGRETVDEIIRLRVQAIGDLRLDLAKLSRDLIVAVEGRT